MQITKSDSTAEISAALCLAQAEMRGAIREAENPHLHSRYADLASVWDACRGPLTKNGLAVIQLPGADGTKVTITTILTHKSGEYFASELTITAQAATPQSIGSCITYARRYALASVAGIAPEDDDAESAEGRGKSRGTKEAAEKLAQEKIAMMQAASESASQLKAARELKPAQIRGVKSLPPDTPPPPADDPGPIMNLADGTDGLTSGDFKARMTAYGDLKQECVKLGVLSIYYDVLGAYGFEHANEISGGREKAKTIYREIYSRLMDFKAKQE